MIRPAFACGAAVPAPAHTHRKRSHSHHHHHHHHRHKHHHKHKHHDEEPPQLPQAPSLSLLVGAPFSLDYRGRADGRVPVAVTAANGAPALCLPRGGAPVLGALYGRVLGRRVRGRLVLAPATRPDSDHCRTATRYYARPVSTPLSISSSDSSSDSSVGAPAPCLPLGDFVPLGPSKSEEGEENDTEETVQVAQMQRAARTLRGRIAADAHDCGAWLALAALQDAYLVHGARALRRMVQQNRVAVLQSALAANPHAEALVLAFFRAADAAWDRAQVAAVWARVLARQGAPDAPPMTPRLWAAYLAFCAASGGCDALREGFAAAVAGLGDARTGLPRAQAELGAVAVLVRWWLCVRQSGRAERALALVQAAVEAAVFAPRRAGLARARLQRGLARFWEAGVPRWGDPGARGWCCSGVGDDDYGDEEDVTQTTPVKKKGDEEDEMYDPFDDDEWKQMYEASMAQADSFLATVKAKLEAEKKKEQQQDDVEEEEGSEDDDEDEEDDEDESVGPETPEEVEEDDEDEEEYEEEEERAQVEKDKEDVEALRKWHAAEEEWQRACWHAAAIDGTVSPADEDWDRFVVSEDVCDSVLALGSGVAQTALVWAALAALGFVPPRAYCAALCTLPELDAPAPVCPALFSAVATLHARTSGPADPWALTGDWRALCPRVFGFLVPADGANPDPAEAFTQFGRRALQAVADSSRTGAADRRAMLASLLLWEHQRTADTGAFTAAARTIIAQAGADALPAWHRFAQCLLARGATAAAERVYAATLRTYAPLFAQPTGRVDDLAELGWMAYEHAATLLRAGRRAEALAVMLQCAGVDTATSSPSSTIAPTVVLRVRAALEARCRSMQPTAASAAACRLLFEVLAGHGPAAFAAQLRACLRACPAERADVCAVALALSAAVDSSSTLLTPRHALVVAAHALRAAPEHLLVHALVAHALTAAAASRIEVLTLLDCGPPAAARTFAALLGEHDDEAARTLLPVFLEHAATGTTAPEWPTGDTRLWLLRVDTGRAPRSDLFAALHAHGWSHALWHAAFRLRGLSAPELRDIARLLVDRGIRVHTRPPTVPPP